MPVEPILDWGVQAILWLQRFSPTLDGPFKALTWMGDAAFYVLFLPALLWVMDRKMVMRLALAVLCSSLINAIAKSILAQPRPFEYDARVIAIASATGGGLPSGHAQNTVVVWGYLAMVWRKGWLTTLAVTLMILVSLSRLYLGVHFPSDLVGGYLLGSAVLWFCYKTRYVFEERRQRLPLSAQVALGGCLSVLMWALNPKPSDDLSRLVAVLLGMAIAFPFERLRVKFEAAPGWRQRALCLLSGLVGGVVVYMGLETALPNWRLARYAALGIWIVLGAPWLFTRLGLSARESGLDSAIASPP